MEYIKQEFVQREWDIVKETGTEHIFSKDDREFALSFTDDNVFVSFPLNNSAYNFKTSFENGYNFDEIYSYIVDKLDYIEN